MFGNKSLHHRSGRLGILDHRDMADMFEDMALAARDARFEHRHAADVEEAVVDSICPFWRAVAAFSHAYDRFVRTRVVGLIGLLSIVTVPELFARASGPRVVSLVADALTRLVGTLHNSGAHESARELEASLAMR